VTGLLLPYVREYTQIIIDWNMKLNVHFNAEKY
jgi:hypothetical protein